MRDSLTPEQPPSEPLYASLTPEPPALGPSRGSQGGTGPQTGAQSLETPDRPAWVDGDPLQEDIANAVWEQCRTEGPSAVVDDPRNIAAVAANVAIRHLGRDRCIHDAGIHHRDHARPVDGCPWCSSGAGTGIDTIKTGDRL